VALWDDGSDSYRMQRDKLAGYFDAHERAGLEIDRSLVVARGSEPLEAVAARLLSSKDRPDAWFSMDDHAAMRVIRVARNRGLRIPEDLAVVGMNDIEPASFSHPSISSVSLPFYEAGRSAIDVLVRLATRSYESVIRVTLAHHLIVRESSGGSAVSERGDE
jgi:DNA-binding LacI/PurR family transcriptional regulator